MQQPGRSRVAVVTGASAGIGLAVASALLDREWHVALTSRSDHRLGLAINKVAYTDERRTRTFSSSTDVRDERATMELFARVEAKWHHIDLTVCCAGVLASGDVEHMSAEAAARVIDTNVLGTFLTARAAVPYLRTVSGTMVMMGSASGLEPSPGIAVYAATKSWVRQFGLSLQGEVGQSGVRIIIINPSRTATNMYRTRASKGSPSPDVLEPGDVAEVICCAVDMPSRGVVQELNYYRLDKWLR